MLSAGMPELQKIKDINYMLEKLHINATDDEARDIFYAEIEKSRKELYRRIDNFIHNYKHKKSTTKKKTVKETTVDGKDKEGNSMKYS